MAVTAALLWGGCMFLVGLINLVAPAYGVDFLRMMSSVYPGFHPSHNVGEWLIGTVYGLLDGAIAGWLFAWIYNAMAGATRQHPTLDMHS
jgi:hypothetical protein